MLKLQKMKNEFLVFLNVNCYYCKGEKASVQLTPKELVYLGFNAYNVKILKINVCKKCYERVEQTVIETEQGAAEWDKKRKAEREMGYANLHYYDHLLDNLEYHLNMIGTFYSSKEECFSALKSIVIGIAPLYNVRTITTTDDFIIWKEKNGPTAAILIQPNEDRLLGIAKHIFEKHKVRTCLIITDDRRRYKDIDLPNFTHLVTAGLPIEKCI